MHQTASKRANNSTVLNAAHANRKSPQLIAVVQPSDILVVRLTEHPSDVVHVKMVVLQRAPQPFLACLTACEALRQAAFDHHAAGEAILIARLEHVERVSTLSTRVWRSRADVVLVRAQRQCSRV